MKIAAFDTLSIARKLKEAGFEEKKAEALATMIGVSRDSRLEHVATENDLRIAVANLRTEIIKIRNEMSGLRTEMARVRAGLDQLRKG